MKALEKNIREQIEEAIQFNLNVPTPKSGIGSRDWSLQLMAQGQCDIKVTQSCTYDSIYNAVYSVLESEELGLPRPIPRHQGAAPFGPRTCECCV